MLVTANNLTLFIRVPFTLYKQPRIIIGLEQPGQLMTRQSPGAQRIDKVAQDFEFHANIERRPIRPFALESNVAKSQFD
jgi:hypothetical protein